MTSHTNKLIWDNLRSWQKDIGQKDDLLDKRKPLRDPVLSPIRKPIDYDFDNRQPVGLNAFKANASSSKAPNRQSKTQEKALAAKEKGNACFQKQQYQQAIQHYSEAIDLDPTNPVYFVNRAMAHLKIKNYLEVEQDCTKCLGLQPNHVKALWRRGMALRSLGRSKEARKDFERALQIEPGNKLIIEELSKLGPEAKEQQPVKEPSSLRTLDIKVIDEAYTPEDTSEQSVAIKSQPTSATKPQPTSATKPQPTSVLPTSKKAPVMPASVSTPPATSTSPPTLTPLKLTCPRTNYEFERDWKACKRRGDDTIYQYLQCIPPASYGTLFKSSLEPDQFEKMVDIIHIYYQRDKPDDQVLAILQGLGQIGRLDMLVMFLDKKTKQTLETIFIKLSQQIPKATLLPLASKFSVKLPQ